jgi:TonB family protein
MARDARFWRNVAVIGLAHVAILIGLIRWSRESKKSNASDIIWMEGGAGDVAAAPPVSEDRPDEPEETPHPTPEASKIEEAEEQPSVTPVKSDIQLPTPVPSPTATPTPKQTATAIPKPSATPRLTPKPTPKTTPTPTPKKKVVAKATPKPTVTPKKKDDTDAKKKEMAKGTPAKEKSDSADGETKSDKPVNKAKATQASGKSSGSGSDGTGSGAGSSSEFGWYGNMLHDRFYSEWVQPTTVVETGVKFAVRVRIRIEKDGSVSKFEIVRPSGNVVVDESVQAISKRVTQVDALPAGLGKSGHYDVTINFELNSEQ